MINRADFDAYCKAVDKIAAAAGETARMQALAFSLPQAGQEPTVAQAREAVIAAMEGTLQVACDSAAALAAEWYDEQAAASGTALDSAITSTVYTKEALEEAVRYAARHLVDGDRQGFAKICGDYAADQARRSVNETIVRNAGRDKDRGVRFARVPTGAETCAFCFMLATRGAVYWSRESAGELERYHHHCDCKVVQGYGAKRYDEIVEGWKPDEAYDRLKLIEQQCGAKAGNEWKANDAVTRSMRLRDKDWLFYGKKATVEWGKTEAEYEASEEGKRELKAIQTLRANGFRIYTRPENAPEGYSNIDLLLGSEVWEIKAPDFTPGPTNMRFVESNLRKAKKQFGSYYQVDGEDASEVRVVLSNQCRKANDAEVERRLKAELLRHHIHEAILICSDNSIKHIRI